MSDFEPCLGCGLCPGCGHALRENHRADFNIITEDLWISCFDELGDCMCRDFKLPQLGAMDDGGDTGGAT